MDNQSSLNDPPNTSAQPLRDIAAENRSGIPHRRTTIDLSTSGRTHPLFPLLDYIARGIHQQGQQFSELDGRIGRIEQECQTIKRAQIEMLDLLHQTKRCSFSLKEEGFETPLRYGVAGLFCTSLTRDITDDSIGKLVRSVLRSAVQQKYKADAAIRFVKHTASIFRTEERRRVLGIAPCQKMAQLTTPSLADAVMAYLKAPHSKLGVYVKNLSLLRRYVKETPSAKGMRNFYSSFKTWLTSAFPSTGEPSEEEWQEVLAADFESYPTSQLDDDVTDGDIETELADTPDLHLVFNDTLSYNTLPYNTQI